MFHSRDANNYRDAINVRNNSTLGGSTSTAVVMAATAETLSTAGAPGTSTTVRTTAAAGTPATADHYNSWDPRKANGSNNIGHSSR
jgi:hypothetical protein